MEIWLLFLIERSGMTISEAIAKIDAIQPNNYDNEMKTDWLSYLDGSIYDSVIKTHVDPPVTEFKPYSSDRMDVSLIVPFPYDEMYVTYLGMKISEANNETGRYNNSAIMFNSQMADFRGFYTRTHKHVSNPRFSYRER